MISLRPYQQEAISLLRASFSKHKRVILCLPTGAGKTVVFSEMIRLAFNKGTQVLVLTDRIELCSQTLKAIFRHNINPQILDASTKIFHPSAPVTLAMAETIKRRMKSWPEKYYSPGLIIADESHKQTFNKILDAFPTTATIGATATPISKTQHLFYTHIVNNIDIPDLIEDGFLVPCRAYMVKDSFDDVKVTHGEYDNKQLFAHFDKKPLYKGVVDNYKAKTPGTSAVCFCVNQEHARKTRDEFVTNGVSAECVTSETPKKEREEILRAFSNGAFDVITNCGILAVGWDFPPLQTIILNRATKSLALFLQMCGRGSRPHPGKTHFTVLDHGANHLEHGMWADSREWSLEPPKKKKRPGAAPVKSCPKCTAMLHAAAAKCPHCGYVFPEKERQLSEGVLVEVKPKEIPEDLRGRHLSQLSLEELVRLNKSGAVSKPMIWRVVRSLGKEAVEKFGWDAGYKPGWAIGQIEQIQDNKYKDKVL